MHQTDTGGQAADSRAPFLNIAADPFLREAARHTVRNLKMASETSDFRAAKLSAYDETLSNGRRTGYILTVRTEKEIKDAIR